MREPEMEQIADMIADVLVEGRKTVEVRREAVELRSGFQTVAFCFGADER